MLTSRCARALGDLADDARAVLADQVELQERCVVDRSVGRRRWRRARRADPGPCSVLEARPSDRPCSSGSGDDHDAGELAGQAGHVAAIPVAAVVGDRAGERVDESGSIVADHREYERRHHRSLARDRHGDREVPHVIRVVTSTGRPRKSSVMLIRTRSPSKSPPAWSNSATLVGVVPLAMVAERRGVVGEVRGASAGGSSCSSRCSAACTNRRTAGRRARAARVASRAWRRPTPRCGRVRRWAVGPVRSPAATHRHPLASVAGSSGTMHEMWWSTNR